MSIELRSLSYRSTAVIAAAVLALSACSSSEEETAPTGEEPWEIEAVFVECESGEELASCEGEETLDTYKALDGEQVDQEVDVCVLVPHVQDPVWLGINYGAASEAERLGVSMQFNGAGGYENIAEQNTQVEDCVSQGYDSVVVGAVSADALDPALAQAQDRGVHIIDGGNGVNSEHVDARAVLDYYQMGSTIGEHLVERNEELSVALLPGPAGAGWSERSVVGFEDAIEGSDVELVDTRYGDPTREVQAGLVEDALSADSELDVVVGTAVTAEVATSILEERGLTDEVDNYSTYISPALTTSLEEGTVACAPNDQGVFLARIMIDLAVRTALDIPYENDTHRAAPSPQLVCGPGAGDADNFAEFDPESVFAPDDWSPVNDVN
ncbi:TMAO reductase system periplasmic protein TorT [Nesterenkonia lutea]|uniref:Protein TorT n=1 Tax=Nesterenkonia lutea TaxID=272919 RepID=A0ABR9JHS1_9MICC|nr:TMAO reductase system periplasmic protein TorT [Nesterenkonia lutea]MBE1525485.1 protein TorT [Nesterenkonia lutea]